MRLAINIVLIGLALHCTPWLAIARTESPQPVSLQSDAVTESSGLAFSHRQADRLWTHNDSGDGPNLFAFDLAGRLTGRAVLPGASSIDWEDMTSFVIDDVAYLLVADVGDNDARRSQVKLHVLREPDPNATAEVAAWVTLNVQYPDGPRDCEAVTVDVGKREIILATKRRLPKCALMTVPLPMKDLETSLGDSVHGEIPGANGEVQVARRIATVPIPMVTAMDLDATSRRLVLCSYFDAFLFTSSATENWREALRIAPSHASLPPLKQIEAIAFTDDGRLWVTSEGRPARLVRLEIPADEGPGTIGSP